MLIDVNINVDDSDIGGFEKYGKEIVREFALLAWTDVVNATPVRTGRARAGWRLSSGRAVTYVPEVGTYGVPRKPRVALSDSYNLVNNVPYIEDLNEGNSRKAPARFVQASVINAEISIKSKYNDVF